MSKWTALPNLYALLYVNRKKFKIFHFLWERKSCWRVSNYFFLDCIHFWWSSWALSSQRQLVTWSAGSPLFFSLLFSSNEIFFLNSKKAFLSLKDPTDGNSVEDNSALYYKLSSPTSISFYFFSFQKRWKRSKWITSVGGGGNGQSCSLILLPFVYCPELDGVAVWASPRDVRACVYPRDIFPVSSCLGPFIPSVVGFVASVKVGSRCPPVSAIT